MAYIGKSPPATALTASDISDGIISADKLATNSVSEVKMADDAISLAELKAGTDGEIISWDASGNPVAIGAGTSGHFLKSQGAGSQPVFAAAGGAWNLLTTVTASDDATVEFTSSIDSTYGMYAIVMHSVSAANNHDNLRVRLSKDGGSNWEDDASDYQYACEGKGSNTEEVQTVSTGQTYMILDAHTYADSGDASHSRTGVVYMANPSSTSKWTVLTAFGGGVSGDNYAFLGEGCGFLQDDGAVTAIQFYMSTGNITTGVFKLYGIS